jgi:signal peptidase I
MTEKSESMMSVLTAALYGALVVYLGGWFLGFWTGNFSLLLFMLTVVTLAFWLAERFYFKPRREEAASRLETQDTQRRAELAKMGISRVDGDVNEGKARLLMQPWWLDWTAGLFPVILIVFLLRSFLFEPFKIPSGSMLPTLESGDLILVQKFSYGVRLPVVDKKLVATGEPARGDVVVFRYPPDPRIDYIKRVVGLPGDEVAWLNKKLTINGKAVEAAVLPDYFDEEGRVYTQQLRENLAGVEHRILLRSDRPPFVPGAEQFPHRDACNYNAEGVTCKVPAGHYFVMGDNRDNSVDSRYWGFVPDRNLKGRAFFVWMNFGNLGRIGGFR